MPRQLGDPFRLDGEALPTWNEPKDTPDLADIEHAVVELARSLAIPTGMAHIQHMTWCLKKMSALPTKNADKMEWAFWAENFFDTSSDIPDDIWSETITELLRTKTFRPSPAEFEKIARPVFLERQRMLERAHRIVAGIKTNRRVEPKPEPAPIDPKQRLRDTIARGLDSTGTFLNGMLMKRAREAERELAKIEQRDPENWVYDDPAPAPPSATAPAYELRTMSPEHTATLKRAIARKHRAEGRTELAAKLFAEAHDIWPLDEFGKPLPHMRDLGLS